MPNPFSFTATAFAGLDRSSGIESLGPTVNRPSLARFSIAENVRFTNDGGVFNRPGFENKANLGTSAKVDSMETHADFSVMFAKSGTKIYQSVDGSTWYDIGLTQTAAEKTFLYPRAKDILATNQTDSFTRIAISTANGAIADTDTEITVRSGDISQFAASGTVYINGDAIAYSGVNATQLTGVTGIASGGHASGSIITQTSTPSGAPSGSCIAELEGSALVGGKSTNGNTLFYSVPATTDNPEYFYDFNRSNGAGVKEMPSNITALRGALGVVMIGMERGIEYAYGYEPNSGSILTSELSRTHSIPNAFCITEMDQEFVILTTEGRILPVRNTENGFVIIEDPNNPRRNFDFPVTDYIKANKDEDMSSSFVHYDSTRKELTAIIPINGLTQEFVYQRDIGMWSVDTTKNFGSKTYFNGRTYTGADDTDKIYLDHEGSTDDTLPITSRIVTGSFRLGRKGVTGDYLHNVFGGLLSGAGEFNWRMYVDGLEVTDELITADDLIDKGLMNTSSGVPLGSGVVGSQTIGSSGSPAEVFSFEFPYEMMHEGESAQMEWEITDEGTGFELRYFDLSGETEGELLLTHN